MLDYELIRAFRPLVVEALNTFDSSLECDVIDTYQAAKQQPKDNFISFNVVAINPISSAHRKFDKETLQYIETQKIKVMYQLNFNINPTSTYSSFGLMNYVYMYLQSRKSLNVLAKKNIGFLIGEMRSLPIQNESDNWEVSNSFDFSLISEINLKTNVPIIKKIENLIKGV